MLQLTILTRNGFVTFHFPWHWWWHHTRPHQLATGAMPLASRLRAPRRARTHAASTLRYLRALSSWPLLTTKWHDNAVDTCIGPRHPLKIGSRQPQIVPIPNSANLRSHWPPPIVSNVVNWSLYNTSTHSLPGSNSVVTRRLHTSTHHQIRQS